MTGPGNKHSKKFFENYMALKLGLLPGLSCRILRFLWHGTKSPKNSRKRFKKKNFGVPVFFVIDVNFFIL
jgi:hypothetical protein